MPAVISGIGLIAVGILMAVANVRVGALAAGGRSIARWVVEGDRWEAFARRQRGAAEQRGKGVGVALAAFLLLTLLTMGSGEADSVFTVWLGLGIIGLVLVATVFRPRASQGPFAASTTKGEVLVGNTYAAVNGREYHWSGRHWRVTKVDVDEGRGVLRVHTRFVKAARATRDTHHDIPSPEGAEEEARALASSLAGTG